MADGTTKTVRKLAHATSGNTQIVPGRRAFFNYRDLGVADASNGEIKAQVMTSIKGLTEPTGWHYHKCESQFVHMIKGWVDLEFETGEQIRLKAGESLYIPGGMRHNEFGTSEDLEILEIVVPANMGTVVCDPPPGAKS